MKNIKPKHEIIEIPIKNSITRIFKFMSLS
jgi:hypothetical protein